MFGISNLVLGIYLAFGAWNSFKNDKTEKLR